MSQPLVSRPIRLLAAVVATLFAALALTLVLPLTCGGYRNRAYRLGERAIDTAPDSSFELAFVEFNEAGRYSDTTSDNSQSARALAMVARHAQRTNTLVLVFVHGWHHNAGACDTNVECFKATLKALHRRLQSKWERDARHDVGLRDSIDVVGIYIGWDGQVAPGALDNLTFLSRKDAAARVGDGDFRTFTSRLDSLYRTYNRFDVSSEALTVPAAADDTYMGLVFVGHSFGGQALFEATRGLFQRQLLQNTRGTAQTAVTNGSDAVAIPGVGDLVVLVNPAVEAAAYDSLQLLAQHTTFDSAQTPALVVVSTEDDCPRRLLFPVGRIGGGFLSLPDVRAAMSHWSSQGRTALGMYEQQVTDTLWYAPVRSFRGQRPETWTTGAPPHGIPGSVRAIDSEPPSDPPQRDGCAKCNWEESLNDSIPDTIFETWGRENFDTANHARAVDFATRDTQHIGGSILTPIQLRPDVRPFSPLVVIRAKPGVVKGHSGIFTNQFSLFLIYYVLHVESKRAALRKFFRDAVFRK